MDVSEGEHEKAPSVGALWFQKEAAFGAAGFDLLSF